MAANNPLVKGDAERAAEKTKQLNRAEVQWALEACEWHRRKNNCSRGCTCHWCKEADIFRAMLHPLNATFLFKN